MKLLVSTFEQTVVYAGRIESPEVLSGCVEDQCAWVERVIWHVGAQV